jgi:Methyltransferase domain
MVVGQVKRWIKGIAPKEAVRAYHRFRRAAEHSRNSGRTPEEVFSEIYRKGIWGGAETQPFYSGTGSSIQSVVEPYVAALSKYLSSLPEGSRRVVDLGCGDFTIGRQLLPFCSSYVGVDVVPDLIHHLTSQVTDPRARFVRADMIEEQLPPGDVCLVRQVLQHLSNAQIAKVLGKLGQYNTVFITEHYPADEVLVTPNKDKVHGGGIRLFEDSAVYLDKKPFEFFPERMQLFLERPDDTFDGLYKPGTIRTFKFELRD